MISVGKEKNKADDACLQTVVSATSSPNQSRCFDLNELKKKLINTNSWRKQKMPVENQVDKSADMSSA